MHQRSSPARRSSSTGDTRSGDARAGGRAGAQKSTRRERADALPFPSSQREDQTMNVCRWNIAVMLTVAALGGAACKSRNTAEEQKKVDDLQKQLDDAKQQLAAKEGEIEAKAAATAAAAEENSRPAAPANEAAKPSRSAAKPAAKATTEQSRVATDLVDQQHDVNARQSETNEQVQRDIEALKPVEYTLPAGTVIPVRTTTELSTSQLANGSTFRAVLERPL